MLIKRFFNLPDLLSKNSHLGESGRPDSPLLFFFVLIELITGRN